MPNLSNLTLYADNEGEDGTTYLSHFNNTSLPSLHALAIHNLTITPPALYEFIQSCAPNIAELHLLHITARERNDLDMGGVGEETFALTSLQHFIVDELKVAKGSITVRAGTDVEKKCFLDQGEWKELV